MCSTNAPAASARTPVSSVEPSLTTTISRGAGSGTVRVWRWTKERMMQAWEEGRVVIPEKGEVDRLLGEVGDVIREVTFAPELPGSLERIILKAMAKAKEDRYASAGELADDLQRFLDDAAVTARAAPRASSPCPPTRAGASGATAP